MQPANLQFIDIDSSTRLAYRRLGRSDGTPLVMHMHFRGNMDFWDPELINGLAAARPVILFDQSGVGQSPGEIPLTFQGWADVVIALMQALNIKQIDLLGFSMGGAAVQMVALTVPSLVRKLILAGTTASAPSEVSDVTGIVWPREKAPREPIAALASAESPVEVRESLAYSFFPTTEDGRAAADRYWARIQEQGNDDSKPPNLVFLDKDISAKHQQAAYQHWSEPHQHNSFDRLSELKMPVLVMNGNNDVLIPTSRSWELAMKIPYAQLIVYPQSGHGFLYQYAKTVAQHLNIFLDDEIESKSSSKL